MDIKAHKNKSQKKIALFNHNVFSLATEVSTVRTVGLVPIGHLPIGSSEDGQT